MGKKLDNRERVSRFSFKSLWTGRFTYWWIVSLATMLMFDLFWMGQTTFRTFGMFTFWPMLFLYATLLAFPALFTRRGEWNLLLLLLADLALIANLMYCRTYFNAIPARSYFLAGNLSDFGPSVADSFRWYFAALPVLSVAAYFAYPFIVKDKRKNPDAAYYFALTGLLLAVAWFGDIWHGGTSRRIDGMTNTAYEASSVLPVYGVPVFTVHDLLKSTRKLTPEQSKEVDEWLFRHETLQDRMVLSEFIPERKRPRNLVLLLCESLESWPLEIKVEGKELTPYLNTLLADSSTFYAPKVLTQADNGRSIEGQLLILSGMLPMRNRVYAYDAVENNFFTIPKAMKEAGGNTYLLSCDKPYVWNQNRVAASFGIDTLLHAADFVIDEKVGAARRLSDGHLMAQSVEKMKKGEVWPEGEKAFVMWVTYSGHNPFKIPDRLKRIEFRSGYPEIVENYMTDVNYTDHALSILIEYLKTRSDWEDTMVVITGDHEGLAFDRKEAIDNPASRKFVDPGQHTPLIILNAPVAGRFEKEMGQADIYSTILDQMGWHDYEWQGMGMSVLDPRHPGIAVGTAGNVEGDVSNVSPEMLAHLRDARDISDLILRFNLLANRKNKHINWH